jgi:solute carrier family 13 (sodium-dependent dicarboxylate transporter), member 2/3/5
MQSISKYALGSVPFLLAAVGILFNLPALPVSGKVALLIFLATIWAWTFSKLDATLVAVVAAFAMWAAGLTGDKMTLSGLGDPFIVFVIAGFMLGGAYKVTGMSDRIAAWFARRSRSISQLFYLLTAALILLSFVIPSTSARAALFMPVYVAVAGTTDNTNVRKALALLFPTVIVLSCVTSYLGAGANLMTADFIEQFSNERITYGQWLLLGAPLGIASCYLSTWVILRVFLQKEERTAAFQFSIPAQPENATANASAQRRVLAATALLITIWMSEHWHGVDAGMVALGGALLLCIPQAGVFTFKQAIKEVEWSLVIFMAATIELSRGLAQSGAVEYAMQQFSTAAALMSASVLVTAILIVALLSHLVINSRTARAAVLMPMLIPLGISAGQSGLLVAFFANAAMGYCLTLPVCAKPVAMFSTAGDEGYTTNDLLRLSTWLLPLHLLLFVGAYKIYDWWLV